ncbi:hypothetical protein [Actinocorallia sp. A-T 12471]|uniref:hypothetical protein n=1 Tax=Actinocorallia sp. A-T 12471 TaxID=3089813 RepID=UPI0029D33965|nr:hypothetical protein [Actinocorallia sp. A-T 12471]MDX6741293.1 hypothetical protein [Actinocorallia sp. A-T 12471]
MPPKPSGALRPVTITAVVDPVAALASGDLDENLYLYDTNRTAGSSGFGTPELRTRVRKGDRLLWNVIPLECETFVALSGIEIDRRVADPVREFYPGTDIAFWTATVKRELVKPVTYRLSFLLGGVAEPFTVAAEQALVGPVKEAR